MGTPDDWTRGPAKWMAVGALAAAAVGTLALSLFGRQSAPRIARAEPPAPIVDETLSEAAPVSPVPSNEPTRVEPPEPVTAKQGPAAESSETTALASEPVPLANIARKINLNTATGAQLELLPGIGPALAQRIIEYRAAHGPFRTIDGLDNVKGIGPKILDKLRPLVTLD